MCLPRNRASAPQQQRNHSARAAVRLARTNLDSTTAIPVPASSRPSTGSDQPRPARQTPARRVEPRANPQRGWGSDLRNTSRLPPNVRHRVDRQRSADPYRGEVARPCQHHHYAGLSSVFQDDLIRAYRTYLDARRSSRPAEEYREPTDAEWAEFQQHFQNRKLELGDCGRPYGRRAAMSTHVFDAQCCASINALADAWLR